MNTRGRRSPVGVERIEALVRGLAERHGSRATGVAEAVRRGRRRRCGPRSGTGRHSCRPAPRCPAAGRAPRASPSSRPSSAARPPRARRRCRRARRARAPLPPAACDGSSSSRRGGGIGAVGPPRGPARSIWTTAALPAARWRPSRAPPRAPGQARPCPPPASPPGPGALGTELWLATSGTPDPQVITHRDEMLMRTATPCQRPRAGVPEGAGRVARPCRDAGLAAPARGRGEGPGRVLAAGPGRNRDLVRGRGRAAASPRPPARLRWRGRPGAS